MIDDGKNKRAGLPDEDAGAVQASPSDPAEHAETDGLASETSKAATVDVQTYIGRQLRAVYDDVAKQPVPERFLALMRQLEQQTPEK